MIINRWPFWLKSRSWNWQWQWMFFVWAVGAFDTLCNKGHSQKVCIRFDDATHQFHLYLSNAAHMLNLNIIFFYLCFQIAHLSKTIWNYSNSCKFIARFPFISFSVFSFSQSRLLFRIVLFATWMLGICFVAVFSVEILQMQKVFEVLVVCVCASVTISTKKITIAIIMDGKKRAAKNCLHCA